MGAVAAHSLLARYDAFAGRRMVVLGSGALGLATALLALERGVEVAAVVEGSRTRRKGRRRSLANCAAAAFRC